MHLNKKNITFFYFKNITVVPCKAEAKVFIFLWDYAQQNIFPVTLYKMNLCAQLHVNNKVVVIPRLSIIFVSYKTKEKGFRRY